MHRFVMIPDTGCRLSAVYWAKVGSSYITVLTVVPIIIPGIYKSGYLVVVVVLRLTHRCNAVRGHRTGSNNSGAEDYLRRKTNKNRR